MGATFHQLLDSVQDAVMTASEEEILGVVAALAGALEVARLRVTMPARLGPAEEPDLTPEEAAAALNISRRAVYEFARRLTDPLPSRRLGRRMRIPRAPMVAWQKRQGEVR